MNHVEESRWNTTLGQHALNVFGRLKKDVGLTSFNKHIEDIGYNVTISNSDKNSRLYRLVVSKQNPLLTKHTEGWSDEKVNDILESVKVNYIAIYSLGPVSSVRKQIMDEMSIFVTTDKDGDRSVSIGIEFIDGNSTYVMLPRVVGYIESIRAGIVKLLAIKFTNNS